ncbi:restriction endonuclease subunit S, partial [Listeria monocytogenes]|nr:restriction endonuclease subunit S [Listeria monocytogenes]
MKKLEKSVPVIRFKGFSEAWEQRKLGEIANSFEYGLNASSKTYDGENKYIRITDIDESSHVFNQDNLTSPDISLDNLNHYLLEEGDILLARTGASTGKSYCYNKIDGKVFFAGFLIRAKIKHEYNVSFIFQSTLTERYNNFIQVTSQRSGQPGINAQEYARFALYIPKLKEQQKIGDFFKQLDDTIALHQRKLDTLKQMKKGLLQQMFPKSEEDVPKIRFADFDEEWYQRKLGEISDKVIEKNKESTYFETLTNSAEYGIISQREFFNKDISNEKNLNGYYIVRENDFVYNPRISNYAPVGPIKRNKLGRIGIVSPLYYVFRTFDTNQSFLEYYFDGTVWHNFMLLNGDSGARADRFAIKDSVLKEMPIPYSTLYEQEKISFFLDEITIIINLHQNKLKKLSSLKKAYLQNM